MTMYMGQSIFTSALTPNKLRVWADPKLNKSLYLLYPMRILNHIGYLAKVKVRRLMDTVIGHLQKLVFIPFGPTPLLRSLAIS